MYYIIAGSADLELSSAISASKFIALYQPVTKSGNPAEKLGDDDTNDCCVSPYDCASQIVLSDDITSITDPQHICTGMPIYRNVAVLGERNTIRSFYTVYVDNNPIHIVLGTTIHQLIQTGKITSAVKIERQHDGHLVRISANQEDIILLPTDHLITK